MAYRFELITRKAAGLPPPKCRTLLPVAKAKGVGIHYSASGAPKRHIDCYRSVKEIVRFHREERGWCDGAYSHIVCSHGKTFRIRGIGVRTAAHGTNYANNYFYAICYLGTDAPGREDFTEAAQQEMAYLLHDLYLKEIGKKMLVYPHSHWKPTACPGDEIRAWILQREWLSV